MPDFASGIGVRGNTFFFRLEAGRILAEVRGEQCHLLLDPTAWRELQRQVKVEVQEFGAEDVDYWYQLPLRGVRTLHWGGEGQIVVATHEHVLFALRHPLPD